ncbi:unnamed protein product [Protopolystoma xenopodis]|uniref:DDE-1 domain-containing protein n=1 Tax=Protopolystoma xenopodis TaxID=117903 RepID=A0A448XIB9_9PLAT|nr:unnamed protein product [Protopolystoma xenopodis]
MEPLHDDDSRRQSYQNWSTEEAINWEKFLGGVKNAWDSVKIEIIVKAFKNVEFLDGSEDHLIYEDGDEDDTDEEELLAKFDASDIEEDEECEGVVTIPDAPDSDDECMSNYYES